MSPARESPRQVQGIMDEWRSNGFREDLSGAIVKLVDMGGWYYVLLDRVLMGDIFLLGAWAAHAGCVRNASTSGHDACNGCVCDVRSRGVWGGPRIGNVDGGGFS